MSVNERLLPAHNQAQGRTSERVSAASLSLGTCISQPLLGHKLSTQCLIQDVSDDTFPKTEARFDDKVSDNLHSFQRFEGPPHSLRSSCHHLRTCLSARLASGPLSRSRTSKAAGTHTRSIRVAATSSHPSA